MFIYFLDSWPIYRRVLFSVYVTGNSGGHGFFSADIDPMLRDTTWPTEGIGENVVPSKFDAAAIRDSFRDYESFGREISAIKVRPSRMVPETTREFWQPMGKNSQGHDTGLKNPPSIPQILPHQHHVDTASCPVAFDDAPHVADAFGRLAVDAKSICRAGCLVTETHGV